MILKMITYTIDTESKQSTKDPGYPPRRFVTAYLDNIDEVTVEPDHEAGSRHTYFFGDSAGYEGDDGGARMVLKVWRNNHAENSMVDIYRPHNVWLMSDKGDTIDTLL